MIESSCGKNCETCDLKLELKCPGCKEGPGNLMTGDCALAKCCRNRKRINCETCKHCGTCRMYASRDRQIELRTQDYYKQQEIREKKLKQAFLLSPYVMVLFFLTMLTAVGMIMSYDIFENYAHEVYVIGIYLYTTCSIAYGVILLVFSRVSVWYTISGIVSLVIAGYSPLRYLINAGILAVEIPSVLSIGIVFILTVLRFGFETYGHSKALEGFENNLAHRWTYLWKWYVIFLIQCGAGLKIASIGLDFGMIMVLLSIVGILAVNIIKTVYLLRTSTVFKLYYAET